MKTFTVGNKYNMRSVCDHNCVWEYTVIKRTSCTVTIQDEKGATKTCRISKGYSEHRGAETIFPLGQYSMCPILSADHTI